MDTKIYANNKGLADMISLKNSKQKTEQTQEEGKTEQKEQKFDVQDLVDLSNEAKEQRKQMLLSGIFSELDDGTTLNEAKQDSLSTMIKSLRKQHTSIKSNIFNSSLDQQKALRGQMGVIENQISTLELKQLELKRKEVGLD